MSPIANQPTELGHAVIQACLAMGFACAGVCPARATSRERELRDWLSAGKHGEMDYMTQLLDQRLDITRLLPGARSVLMVADQYARRETDPPVPTGNSLIARYARGRDYHTEMKGRLHDLADALRSQFPHAHFRTFVDTAPVMEREHAQRAGLGFIGKHTLLINPKLGSWLLLAGIATSLQLCDESATTLPPRDSCGSCTRCIDACPTHAITPFSVDARLCISYLTLEHHSPIDPSLHAPIGNRLVGCDVCQEVCPFNAPSLTAPDRTNPAYSAHAGSRTSLPINHVRQWSEDDRRTSLTVSAAKRATLAMLHRNAAINAANAAPTPL